MKPIFWTSGLGTRWRNSLSRHVSSFTILDFHAVPRPSVITWMCIRALDPFLPSVPLLVCSLATVLLTVEQDGMRTKNTTGIRPERIWQTQWFTIVREAAMSKSTETGWLLMVYVWLCLLTHVAFEPHRPQSMAATTFLLCTATSQIHSENLFTQSRSRRYYDIADTAPLSYRLSVHRRGCTGSPFTVHGATLAFQLAHIRIPALSRSCAGRRANLNGWPHLATARGCSAQWHDHLPVKSCSLPGPPGGQGLGTSDHHHQSNHDVYHKLLLYQNASNSRSPPRGGLFSRTQTHVVLTNTMTGEV
jgi:hypothetical protein